MAGKSEVRLVLALAAIRRLIKAGDPESLDYLKQAVAAVEHDLLVVAHEIGLCAVELGLTEPQGGGCHLAACARCNPEGNRPPVLGGDDAA